MSYNGQRCTALKILFVQRSIADLFTQKFVAGVEALKIGQPYGYYTTVNDPRVHRDIEAMSAITPMPEK